MKPIQTITVAFWVLLAVGAKAEANAPASVPVKGKTVDSAGHPVAGVVVQQYAYRQSANNFELEMQQQATSGADGTFELQVARTSALPQTPILLIARKAGLAAGWTQMMAGAGADPRLVLTPSSFLAGKVVDESEKPVAGAEVHVVMAYSETPGEGPSRSVHCRPHPGLP